MSPEDQRAFVLKALDRGMTGNIVETLGFLATQKAVTGKGMIVHTREERRETLEMNDLISKASRFPVYQVPVSSEGKVGDDYFVVREETGLDAKARQLGEDCTELVEGLRYDMSFRGRLKNDLMDAANKVASILWTF